MNELILEVMESSNEASGQEASGCPMHAMRTQRTLLDADDELVFPKHKRVVTRYSSDAAGVTELHLYYGEKEILFDEPELFAFGEGLALAASPFSVHNRGQYYLDNPCFCLTCDRCGDRRSKDPNGSRNTSHFKVVFRLQQRIYKSNQGWVLTR